MNRYAYAGGDPIHGVDPGGTMSLGEMGVAQSIAVSLAFSVPFNVTSAYIQVRDGADFGTAVQQAAVSIAADGLIGAVLPGVGRFAAAIMPIRIGAQVARAAGSVWNLLPFARGAAIEASILGRPAQILGKPPGNFRVIDDLTDGVATSIKSLDLTAASYQAPAAVIARINEYAQKLTAFSGAGGSRVVTPNMIKEKVLVVAMEYGAATSAQARALAEFQRNASSLWPNIKIIIQAIP